MTKISNQVVYIPDTEISGLDYFIGTDIDQGKRTVNFRMEEVGSHFNMVNGVRNFDYNFYEHQGVNPKPSDGYFYSNGNNQNPNNITHFIFSKKTARNKDSSIFFESIVTDNPFDLIISQKVDTNTVFFFRINSIETFSNYYKLNVSEVFFPQGKEISYVLSYAVFNLKSEGVSVHNNLTGLNDGDYIHLTQAEKDKLDNLSDTGVILLREEFIFSGSQTITLSDNYSQVYSVEVQGQGALFSSQYTLIAPNQILINDTLDIGDYIVVLYSTLPAGVLPYYSQSQVDSLLENYFLLQNNINNEIPIGIINGVNSIFTIQSPLLPNSEEVFVNGQKQVKINDYNISGQTITFMYSPAINEVITINYIKQ